MLHPRLKLLSIFAAAASLALPAWGEVIYGSFNNGNNVLSFDTANVGTILTDHPLSGPPPSTISDVILGLAVRPDNGQLYGVSGTGVYVIDPNTGNKTLVSPSPLTLQFDEVTGASFEPGTANLFVTSFDSRDLLEVNVDTGAITNHGQLAFAPTDVNSGKDALDEALTWGKAAGDAAPALYGIDTSAGLVTVDPFTALESTIGAIPAFAGSGSGASFTYSTLTGTAYVDFRKSSNGSEDQFLYTVNLRSGASQLVGIVDDFPPGLLAIAAANSQAVPEPATLSLLPTGAALLFGCAIARRRTAKRL